MLGVKRNRTTVHERVQKVDLQPADSDHPDRLAVDQKRIRVNDKQYWLYPAVDPENNRTLSRLFSTDTVRIGLAFLTELAEKRDCSDGRIRAFSHPRSLSRRRRRRSQRNSSSRNLNCRVETHGDRNGIKYMLFNIIKNTSVFKLVQPRPPADRGYVGTSPRRLGDSCVYYHDPVLVDHTMFPVGRTRLIRYELAFQ